MSHEPISRQVSSSAEGTSTEEELPEIDADRVSRISSISTETDTQTVIRVDTGRGRTSTETTDELLDSPTSRQVDPLRAEAVRKLLTEQQRSSPFQRDVASYRSYRMEKGKANDLEYIAERHTNVKILRKIICF